MITSAKNYTNTNKEKNIDRQNPRTSGKSRTIQRKSHKVLCLNFGMIRCLFRYSSDAGYIQLIVEI